MKNFQLKERLVHAPDGENAGFLAESEKISSKCFYELFRGSNLHELLWIQFLAALNVFLGEKSKISNNAMSEFH